MNILLRAVTAFKKGLNPAQAILLTFYKTFEMGYESMGFESAKTICLRNIGSVLQNSRNGLLSEDLKP